MAQPTRQPRRPGPILVAVVDDDGAALAGLRALLAGHAHRVRLVVSADSGPDQRPDVLLCATHQSPGAFADLVARTTVRVAVYSSNRHPGVVTRRVAQGAAGYLSKRLSAERLVDALEAIRDGLVVVDLGGAGARRPDRDRPLPREPRR